MTRIKAALEIKTSTREVVTHFVVRDRLKDDPATGCDIPTEHMICTPLLTADAIDCPECQVVFVARALRETETD